MPCAAACASDLTTPRQIRILKQAFDKSAVALLVRYRPAGSLQLSCIRHFTIISTIHHIIQLARCRG